jgi:sulfotransferase family protein
MLGKDEGTKSMKPGSSQPVFVVGVYRSGTSLLYALLNQHPQMALMYECDVWNFPGMFSKMRFKRDWLQRLEFYNKALSRHRLIFGGSLRGLENTRTPEDLYRTFSDGKNKTLFGEKSPFYCTRLRQLVRSHPGCSFILIWRDPIEIYRSIVRAAHEEPFFRRRGILSRLIFYQEQLIQQAAELEHAGSRLCHVTYADLTDDTGNACRKICGFLGIEFNERMLDLANADLSAIHPGQQHEHLRHGRIERQQFAGEIMHPPAVQKLQRFNSRWNRLQSRWLDKQINSSTKREPSLGERFYSRMTGSFFCAMDDARRVLLEFLPLPWLRTYRHTKTWFLAQQSKLPADRLSLREQFSNHRITILTSCVILAGVTTIDYLTGPNVSVLPFYLIPSAILTLIVNSRWGTLAAAASAVVWSVLWTLDHSNVSSHFGLILWNCAMRFLLLQFVVLLVNCIRIEIMTADNSAD